MGQDFLGIQKKKQGYDMGYRKSTVCKLHCLDVLSELNTDVLHVQEEVTHFIYVSYYIKSLLHSQYLTNHGGALHNFLLSQNNTNTSLH